ncbi:Scr1 family TA system antitoxin-like transcriptional regulator [Glycomyces sp. NPDC047010]|uniref:Scr1 family TA system antitoxin-like transcriptional regulator n=1 Tax=Glycomyces sp. NPDC047010 TaxID=3155023 RepID=UPI0033CAFA35
MAGNVLNEKLVRSYLFAEVNTICRDSGWTRNQFARVMRKSSNTVRAWLDQERLPDLGNLLLICERGGVDEARKRFILHVREQLHTGQELVSDLDKRSLYIVESGERTYPHHTKWDPLLFPALVQTEAVHMKVLADPMDDPADKIKHWLRKERRAETFFARFSGDDHPTAEIFVPSGAIADLGLLTAKERAAQIDRLLWADSLPGCEVFVVQPPHLATYAFDSFSSNDLPDSGPNFVYVEHLDQSRHVVDEAKLALYDQARSFLRTRAQGIGRFLDGGAHRLAEEHSKQ